MITEDDYEILSAWFYGKAVADVTNQVLSTFQLLLNDKVNRCEEIYSVLNPFVCKFCNVCLDWNWSADIQATG